MSIFTLSNMSIVGNVAEISDVASSPNLMFVQPGASIEVPDVPLSVRKGVLSITVGAIDKERPSEQGAFNCVPVLVEVFEVGATAPAGSVTTPSGAVDKPTPEMPRSPWQGELSVDTGNADETAPYRHRRFSVRITNHSDRTAQVTYRIEYVRDTSLVTESAVPLRVLNGTFGILLAALAPEAELRNKKLTLRISPEIAEFVGSLPANGVIEKDLSDLPVELTGELTSLSVELVAGAQVLQAVDERAHAEDQALLRRATPTPRELRS